VQGLVVALLAGLAYLLCLPWDLRNRPATPGTLYETSPVRAIGVLGLAAVLVVLSAYLGLRGWSPWWAPLLVGVPPAALMFVSFATHPARDANPWPILWALCAILLALGPLAAAAVAALVRRAYSR
jgi:hypothetical protein